MRITFLTMYEITDYNFPQVADTTNRIPIQFANEYIDLMPVFFYCLLCFYFIFIILVVCRRVWGLLGQQEHVHFQIFGYDHKKGFDSNKMIFNSEVKKFNSRIICPIRYNNFIKWKVSILPANPEEVIFVDDIVYRKTEEGGDPRKLAYLVKRDKQTQRWYPFSNHERYLIPKNSFSPVLSESLKLSQKQTPPTQQESEVQTNKTKEQSELLAQSTQPDKLEQTEFIKIYCILLDHPVKRILFSIRAKFEPIETKNYLKKLIFNSLDFYENKACRLERYSYIVLIVSLLLHLIWLAIDIYHYENGGGNLLHYPKKSFIPIFLWPLLFRPRKSAAKILTGFIGRISAIPLNRIFGDIH